MNIFNHHVENGFATFASTKRRDSLSEKKHIRSTKNLITRNSFPIGDFAIIVHPHKIHTLHEFYGLYAFLTQDI